MRTRSGLITALLILAACLVPEHSQAKTRLAPAVPCSWANRMDIFIDEDNIMYACECEGLIQGVICRWQVIGGVDAPSIRKRLRRPHRSRFALIVRPLHA